MEGLDSCTFVRLTDPSGLWILVLFWMLVRVVRGDYNCSNSKIPESEMGDFKEHLKRAGRTLSVNLYMQQNMKLNLSSTSEKSNHTVGMWGGCDVSGTSDDCRDCVNELTASVLTICSNSSWGELNMVVKGRIVCFVHYVAVDYAVDNVKLSSAILIQMFPHSLLFFLLWHLLMFLYMCLM